MTSLKELLRISDIEFWKELRHNWNHGSVKDQMLFCLLITPMLTFLVFYNNGMPKIQQYFVGGMLLVLFVSIFNTWAFAKGEYEERNYKCNNCGNPMEHKLIEDHTCPEDTE